MIKHNPVSYRENSFMRIYESEAFKRSLWHKDGMPDFPHIVDIELTNCCNLNCIFCGQQAMSRPKGFMSEGVFKKIVDECLLYNTPVRFIRWGEPFLHPKIDDFCKYVKSKGLMLHITNNGLAIKESHMEMLVKLEVDSIIFSFQGATKEQYEIMRNNFRYGELKDNIFKLIEIRGGREKPFIHISSTMTNETKEVIDTFVNNWAHVVDSVGIGKTNLSRLSAAQIKTCEAASVIETLKKQETIEKRYKPCIEVYQKLNVDWDGRVSCCAADFDHFLTVGDIKEVSLSNIWNNSRELKIFRELLDKNLHRCLTLCSTCYHTYEEF